jgi:hypothetical protein
MYDPGMYNLVNCFPQNLFNYRPIRYFFQRPVYIDTSQPEVRQIVAQRKTDEFVSQTIDKAAKAYAIPLKYEDLIKNGEVLNQALAKVIDPKDVKDQLREIEKQKNDLIKKKENELYGLKDKVNKKRMDASVRIKKLSKKMKMFRFYRIYIKFALSLKYIKSNEEIIIQNTKNSLDELTNFAVRLFKNKNIIDFFSQTLKKKIELKEHKSDILDTKTNNIKRGNKDEKVNNTVNTNNLKGDDTSKDKKANPFFKEMIQNSKGKNDNLFVSEDKVENSIFVLKTTIHNIMNILTNSINKPEDIPQSVHKAFNFFIMDGAILPKNFLTTLEFNRLEWSLRIKLIKMNIEKKAMMICSIFLYRVIIMNVFMNILKYFPEFKKINDYTIMDISGNFEYNFKLIGTILAKIYKESIPKPTIYREYYKEKFLYNYYAIESNFEIEEAIKADQFELEKMLPVFQEGEEFIVNNYKWATLYKLSSSSFCMNMVDFIK